MRKILDPQRLWARLRPARRPGAPLPLLRPVPAHLHLGRVILPGAWRGPLQTFEHPASHHALWRWSHHKRWFYVTLQAAPWMLAAAVVDTGYAVQMHCMLAHLEPGQLKLHLRGLSPSIQGGALQSRNGDLVARAQQGERYLELRRLRGGEIYLNLTAPEATLRGRWEPSQVPALIAAAELAGGGTHLTHKTVAQRATLQGQMGAEALQIQGWGGSDHSDGFVPRETRWNWVYFTGHTREGISISLNLVQGFLGACECVLWLGSQLITLGEGNMDVPDDPALPWRIRSACGRVDLTFQPRTLEVDRTDVMVARSHFVQAFGFFSGRLRVTGGDPLLIQGLPGVAEQQDVRW
jgi:hypothetical protein